MRKYTHRPRPPPHLPPRHPPPHPHQPGISLLFQWIIKQDYKERLEPIYTRSNMRKYTPPPHPHPSRKSISLFAFLAIQNVPSEDFYQTAQMQRLNLQRVHMYKGTFSEFAAYIQSTLVISNSLISNNRLSRSENLVPVLTQRSTNRQQNIVEKRRNCSLGAISPLFHNIFNISNLGVKLHIHSVKSGCSINCFPHFRNLIYRSRDISKCFIESLGV